jgi:hypothetical protein
LWGLWTATNGTGNTANFLFDVTGYFTSDVYGQTYHAIAPIRVLDTRFNVGHSGGIVSVTPTPVWAISASAVTGNLTVSAQGMKGWAYVGPYVASPSTSNINFPYGENKSDGVTVALSGGYLYIYYGAWAGYYADFIFDITGYFQQ